MSYTDVNKSLDYLYSTINDRSNMSLGRVLGGLGAEQQGINQYNAGELTNAIIERILQININLGFIDFRIESLIPDVIEDVIEGYLKGMIQDYVNTYVKDKLDLEKPEKIDKLIDIILDGMILKIRELSSRQIGVDYIKMIDDFWPNIYNELGGSGEFISNLLNSGIIFTHQWSLIAEKAPSSLIYCLFTSSSNSPFRNSVLELILDIINISIPRWLIGDTVGELRNIIKIELIKIMNSIADELGIRRPYRQPSEILLNETIPTWINDYVSKANVTIPFQDWWKENQVKILDELVWMIRRVFSTDYKGAATIATIYMIKIANLLSQKAVRKIYNLHKSNPQEAKILLFGHIMKSREFTAMVKKEKETVNILPIIAVAGLAALYFLKK